MITRNCPFSLVVELHQDGVGLDEASGELLLPIGSAETSGRSRPQCLGEAGAVAELWGVGQPESAARAGWPGAHVWHLSKLSAGFLLIIVSFIHSRS